MRSGDSSETQQTGREEKEDTQRHVTTSRHVTHLLRRLTADSRHAGDEQTARRRCSRPIELAALLGRRGGGDSHDVDRADVWFYNHAILTADSR